jgi:ferric-dicitrate binding protein FerR (iron transport regulator)
MDRPDVESAIHAWRRADESARAAERQLQSAWHQYYAKPETPISRELIQSVADHRSRANAHLSVALALLGASPKDLRQGSPSRRNTAADKPT